MGILSALVTGGDFVAISRANSVNELAKKHSKMTQHQDFAGHQYLFDCAPGNAVQLQGVPESCLADSRRCWLWLTADAVQPHTRVSHDASVHHHYLSNT